MRIRNSSNRGYRFIGGYSERNQRLAIVGEPSTLTSSVKPLRFEGVKRSQTHYYTGAEIECVAGLNGDMYLSMEDCQDDGAAGSTRAKFERVKTNSVYSRIEIAPMNIMGTDAADGVNVRIGGNPFKLYSGQRFQYNIGGGNPASSDAQVVYGTGYAREETLTSGAATLTWQAYGVELLEVTLSGGSPFTGTIANPGGGNKKGARLTVIVITSGAASSIAFGTVFDKQDGTDVGTIAAGATAQRIVMEFIHTGGSWRMTGPLPTFA